MRYLDVGRQRKDLNGDGYADLVVGAPHDLSGVGYTYVYFGGPGLDGTALMLPVFPVASRQDTGIHICPPGSLIFRKGALIAYRI